MIYPPLAAWAASHKGPGEHLPSAQTPIYESMDEARKSLINEKGFHEYWIREHDRELYSFRVYYIQDNQLVGFDYPRKIVGFR